MSQDQVPVRDTAVPPIERQPLTEADRVGLEPMNLSVELPWTGNQVSKDPAEAAPRATLLSLETLSTEGFDRAVFTFGGNAPFPGYRVRRVAAGAEPACAEALEAPAEGHELLEITLRPVYADREAATDTGLEPLGQSRFGDAGVACSDGDAVIWVARVPESEAVRVLELREPERLVVDLR